LSPARHWIAESPGLLPLPVLREDDFQSLYFEDNKLGIQNTRRRRQLKNEVQALEKPNYFLPLTFSHSVFCFWVFILTTDYCPLVFKMRDLYLSYTLDDNGGRRIGIERRRFSYAEHIPERRSGEDRRNGVDRRTCIDGRSGMDRRVEAKRRATERGGRRETTSRHGAQERWVSDDRRRLRQDRRKVARSTEASRERRGQELRDPLEG
jgi:hypothetical protein